MGILNGIHTGGGVTYREISTEADLLWDRGQGSLRHTEPEQKILSKTDIIVYC